MGELKQPIYVDRRSSIPFFLTQEFAQIEEDFSPLLFRNKKVTSMKIILSRRHEISRSNWCIQTERNATLCDREKKEKQITNLVYVDIDWKIPVSAPHTC